MTPTIGLTLITWLFLGLLYLSLAHLLTKLSELRGELHTLRAHVAARDSPQPLTPADLPSDVIALAVLDSTCPSCWQIAEEIQLNVPVGRVAILTHEDPAVWRAVTQDVPIIQDLPAWSSFAPMSPPVLARFTESGAMTEVAAPIGADEARTVLQSWLRTQSPEAAA